MRRISELMARYPTWVLSAMVVITALLAIPFLTMAPTESASTEPSGAVFDARDSIDERFVSSVYPVFFVIEDREGDLLRAEPLRQLLEAGRALRDDPELRATLFSSFEPETGREVRGILTLADLVDEQVPGGLGRTDDAAVKAVGGAIIGELGEESSLLGLSTESFIDGDGGWIVPAISLPVLADNEVLGFGNTSINLGGDTVTEDYARALQSVMREAAPSLDVYGVAIDVNLTSQEQGQLAGPFIGFTIFAVLLVVGAVFRSYWVLAVVGAALGALIIWLKGISNLIGLKDDLVLSLIVPIAMISFGVDFAFHAVGRYREERTEGARPRLAFVTGLAAVSGALVLALTSDTVAFLANVSAGIESIVQFGVGAAIALAAAYLLLGLVTPLAVSVVEEAIGEPAASRRNTIVQVLASLAAAGLAMASVLLMVFVLPLAGLVAYGATLVMTLAIPFVVARRLSGPLDRHRVEPGSDRLSVSVGRVIAAIARRRRLVVPIALAVSGLAAVYAVQVPAEFDVEDFFSADTDFVTSLELLDRHVGDRGGEPAQIYVEADLADPAVLEALRESIDTITESDSAQFGRSEGLIRVEGGVFEVFDAVLGSQASMSLIEARTGVVLSDIDSDGIPDSREQVEAVYEVTTVVGVPVDGNRPALTPDDVRTAVAIDERGMATVFELGLVNSRSQDAISQARTDLEPVLVELGAELEGSFVELTGSPFVRQASLDATNRALQVSLPIAVILCLLVASTFLRSIRYGLASVVPIAMTVAWLYAFMERAGFAINIVTATIAAVSVGIGIDFAIHYIARYREELARHGQRIAAARIAGEGTGTALVASATSSALGFGILAFAPMPLFAAYGLLTAIMIGMALVATLIVLPSVLVLVTRDAVEETTAAVGAAA